VCTQVEVCSSNQAYFESPKELGMQINQFLDQNRKKTHLQVLLVNLAACSGREAGAEVDGG
jgi:hypothetical protein